MLHFMLINAIFAVTLGIIYAKQLAIDCNKLIVSKWSLHVCESSYTSAHAITNSCGFKKIIYKIFKF